MSRPPLLREEGSALPQNFVKKRESTALFYRDAKKAASEISWLRLSLCLCAFVSLCSLRVRRLGCHMEQGAGIGVFQHPQRAIGGFFHIADAVAHTPALGGFGAAMAVKDNAVERH